MKLAELQEVSKHDWSKLRVTVDYYPESIYRLLSYSITQVKIPINIETRVVQPMMRS